MPLAEAVDPTPKGYNEKRPDGTPMDRVKRHDRYEDKPASTACCHNEAHA